MLARKANPEKFQNVRRKISAQKGNKNKRNQERKLWRILAQKMMRLNGGGGILFQGTIL